MSLASREIKVKTAAENTASDLLLKPARSFKNLLSDWQEGIDMIWDSQNPQAIFDALGTDAALLVEDSTATIKFLEGRVKDSTVDRIAKIKPFTVNGDGTVTVTVA